jgi:Uma2 family endonuclease
MALQLARHRFTVDEYHRMAEVGLLHEDSSVELIDGEIVDMSPIGHRHAVRVAWLSQLFAERLGRLTFVWAQNPVHLYDQAEPEPDVTLLRPREDFYAGKRPDARDVLLVIEVADSSLEYDRCVKAPLYARHGIPEYWLVNLVEGHVAVYRDPAPDGYRSVHIARPGEALRPLAFPDFVVSVDEILG